MTQETDLQFKARVLDPVSSSFCLAKWYNATIWLGSGMTTSCHHPLPHYVPVEDAQSNCKSIHNTPQKKLERQQMKNGERPSGCSYCWKIEDMGDNYVSDRVYKSKIYNNADIIAAVNLPTEQDVDLRTLEIAFDRTCNFSCSYCNPAFSSSWVRDIKRNGGYENLISDGRNHFTHPHDSSQRFKRDEENPYVTAFFEWWETSLKDTLEELRITGGEPTMSDDFWRLVDWFKTNNANPDMRFAVNSNLGAKPEIMQRLFDATADIPHLHVYTSCEATGAQAEYIRDGLDYAKFKENMHAIAQTGNLEGLHMMCTVNALCLQSLTDFLDECVEFKQAYGRDFPTFTLNILRFPSFQSPLVLPIEEKQRAIANLTAWQNKHADNPLLHEMERNQVTRLIEYLESVIKPHDDAFDMPALHNDFKQFYAQYDARRGKDFAATFPALAEWYNAL